MVEIKDIVGLSKPLTRLIEIIAEGVGAISRPYLIRRNADAGAYEIRTIATAIEENYKLLGPMKYENGKICIEAASTGQPELPETTLDKRVLTRMAYQEAKKQINIEQVASYAAEELKDEQDTSSEKPNSDWITRFFRIAEDVTIDEMQMLWGKVLAGEVKRPGSYSLRALDVLKNITQQEAELFVRVGQISFVDPNGKTFLPDFDDEQYLKDHFGLRFTDFLLLIEIGLLVEGLTLQFNPAKDNRKEVFICGNTVISVKRPKGTPEQVIKVFVFTSVGRQLLQLVERKPVDPGYIKEFASLFRLKGVSIQTGLVLHRQGDQIRFANLHEVFDEATEEKE